MDDVGRIPVPGTSVQPVHKQGWDFNPACAAGTPKGPRAQPTHLRAPRCSQSSFVSLLRDLARVVRAPTAGKGFLELVVELRGKAALWARAWVQGKGSGAANPCPEGRSRGSKAAKCKRGFCERQHARLCKPTWAGSSFGWPSAAGTKQYSCAEAAGKN